MKRTRKKRKPTRKQLLKRSKLTPQEFKQLKNSRTIADFRRKSILINGEFKVDIEKFVRIYDKKKKKYTFNVPIPIDVTEFEPGKKYRIYVRHTPSKRRRLLSSGVLYELPIRSKAVNRFAHLIGGRKFNPKLKSVTKAKGNWIPLQKIIPRIEKELESKGKKLGAEVRAAIIPMVRYFHNKWMIYSDKPLKASKKVRLVLVHCVIHYEYPRADWIGKQSIKLEFTTPKRIDKLASLIPKLEQRIGDDLDRTHPQADAVSLIEVNGFIPLGV